MCVLKMRYIFNLLLLTLVIKGISTEFYCYVCNDCNDPVHSDRLELCNENTMTDTTTTTTTTTITPDIDTTVPESTDTDPTTTESQTTITDATTTDSETTTTDSGITNTEENTTATDGETTDTEDITTTTTVTDIPITSSTTTIGVSDTPTTIDPTLINTTPGPIETSSTTVVVPTSESASQVNPMVIFHHKFKREVFINRQDDPQSLFVCFRMNVEDNGQQLINRGCARRMATSSETCLVANNYDDQFTNCEICDGNECNTGIKIMINNSLLATIIITISSMIIFRLL